MSKVRKNKRTSGRKARRRLGKLTESLKVNFAKLSEQFASDYLNESVEGISKSYEQIIIEQYDERWRSYARWILSKYPEVNSDEKKRLSILNRFKDFTDKFLQRKEEQEEQEKTIELDNMDIEVMRKALKVIGVTTQAKTQAGMQKRINELSSERKKELVKVINSGEL